MESCDAHKLIGLLALLSFKEGISLLSISSTNSIFPFLRVTWVSWGSCWCRGRSACGRSTRKVTPRSRIWPVSSPCSGTCSSTRKPCSSARGGRRMERATRKLRRTASSSLWTWEPPQQRCCDFCRVSLLYSSVFSLWTDERCGHHWECKGRQQEVWNLVQLKRRGLYCSGMLTQRY